LRKQHPDKQVEVWAEDEGRMGLKPITRRQWAPRGQRPIAVQQRSYQWLHTYVFVQPRSGNSAFWLASHVDIPTMQAVLDAFIAIVNPNNTKLIVLLLDNAGWHVSKHLQLPESLILYPILAYTPELSPAEPVMPLLHESLANKTLTELEQVEANLEQRCQFLHKHPEIVKGACGFNWASL
jgi:DDE superfamily endonuclease